MTDLKKKKRSIIKRELKNKLKEEKKKSNSWAVTSKNRRISPKKLTPIANIIRGQKYIKSSSILNFMPNKGAEIIKKVLDSAVSNALFLNHDIDEEDLFVEQIFINEGPRMKRIHRGSRGQMDLILKRTSHINVVITKK